MDVQVAEVKTLKFKSARGDVRLLVLGETPETYIVCSAEEYDAARRENREPRLVGFPKADALEQ